MSYRLRRPAALRLATLAAALAVGAGAGAADLPFVGKWTNKGEDCSAPFIFANDGYAPPAQEMMRYKALERTGGDFVMVFPDDYTISLSDIKSDTMTWFSPGSGDSFELVRCQ